MAKESFIIFSQNAEGEFTFKLKEKNNILAVGVEVVFTIEDENGDPSSAVTIEAVTLPIGTYLNNKWTVGNIRMVTYEPVFKAVVQNNTSQFVRVSVDASTSSNERDKSTNLDIIDFIGPNLETITPHINEKVVSIPGTAFADVNNPLTSEVETWVANIANVSAIDSLNGTMIEYNNDPYTEVLNYITQSESVSVPNAGSTGNFEGVRINGTLYSTTIPYDDGANTFDDVAAASFIASSVASEGVTGTVTVANLLIFGSITFTVTTPHTIDTFAVVFDSVETEIADISAPTKTGSRESAYVWRLNNNAGAIKVTEVRKKSQSNVWHISTLGENDRVLEGDARFPAKSMEGLLEYGKISAGSVLVYSSEDHTAEAIYNIPTYQGPDKDTVLDANFVFEPGSSITFGSTASAGGFINSLNSDSEYQPADVQILGKPNVISTLIGDKLIRSEHPKNEHIIHLGEVSGATCDLYQGAGKYVDIDIDKLTDFTNRTIYFTCVSGSVVGFEKSDADTDALQDNAFVSVKIKDIVSTISARDLMTFGIFGQSADISNLSFLLDIGTYKGSNHTSRMSLLDISCFTGASSGPEFGFVDSTFRINIGQYIDDHAGASVTPYTVSSIDRLINFRERLVDSTVIIQGKSIRTGNVLFGFNAFSGDANETIFLDNSKIIFRDCDIEAAYNLFNFALQNNSSIDNNSEIVFENCRLTSLNSYIADFDLRPGNADDGTAIVRFKNCRLETKAASQSLIHFRGTNLILENCTLVNDGTTEDITTDAGVGTINLTVRNTYSNCLTSTNTGFSLVAGNNFSRDADVI